MTELIIILGLTYILIIVLMLLLIRHYYLKGQLKGWQERENLVVKRIKKNAKYRYKEVVEDLLS
jgi:uncharacterized membrane protein affecting hemolysin expression